MNYLKKLMPYNLKQKLQILGFSVGSVLANRLSSNLKNTYLLTNKLLELKVKVKNRTGTLTFDFTINNKLYNFNLSVNSSDAAVFNQIVLNEEYKVLIEIFEKLNLDPKNMIDAGANIGLTTIYFKAHFPNLSIISLEPAKETYKRLKNNSEINSLNEVELIQKGLWSSETCLKEDRNFRDGEDWSFRLIETDNLSEALFTTTTIDQIMTLKEWEYIDFLKMDIEGGENEIFKTDNNCEWLNKIKIIAIEIHDEFNCRSRIEDILFDFNFKLTYSGELTIGVNKTFFL